MRYPEVFKNSYVLVQNIAVMLHLVTDENAKIKVIISLPYLNIKKSYKKLKFVKKKQLPIINVYTSLMRKLMCNKFSKFSLNERNLLLFV